MAAWWRDGGGAWWRPGGGAVARGGRAVAAQRPRPRDEQLWLLTPCLRASEALKCCAAVSWNRIAFPGLLACSLSTSNAARRLPRGGRAHVVVRGGGGGDGHVVRGGGGGDGHAVGMRSASAAGA